MTVHTPKLLTPEEFASLIEVAVHAPEPNVPASHLAKLVTLGFVAITAKGPVVTGDGLIRITESEWTQTPPVGDGAPKEGPEKEGPEKEGPEQDPERRRRDRSVSDRPTDDELLRHLGAAVLLCWDDLSFSSQVKILAQTNDVIGTRPIPEARNEIVKLLLRHTKL